MENNGNLHFSPAANFFICPVHKRDFATQTDSDGKGFSSQFTPECLTPDQSPSPSTPLNLSGHRKPGIEFKFLQFNFVQLNSPHRAEKFGSSGQ